MTPIYATLATLNDVRRELRKQEGAPNVSNVPNAPSDADAEGNADVMTALRTVTTRINGRVGYPLLPHRNTFGLMVPNEWTAAGCAVTFGTPVLDVVGLKDAMGAALVVWDGQSATYDAANVLLHRDATGLVRRLERKYPDGCHCVASGGVTVDGVWGFSRSVASAWLDSGDSVKTAVDATTRLIAVNDVDGEDGMFRKPRFSPGQLLRVGDEFMGLLAVDKTAHMLKVQRAIHGTAATAHAAGAPITVWQVEADVQRAASRWAAYLYRRRGAFDTYIVDNITGNRMGQPKDMPAEVEAILDELPSFKVRAKPRAV